MEDGLKNRLGGERISDRQVDELIGLAKGIAADGQINESEVLFLQRWLAANLEISGQPIVRTLYERLNVVLADGIIDDEEKTDLLQTLNSFSRRDFELGEALKPTSLPLCSPAPNIQFPSRQFCFTGTFIFGQRKSCEAAVIDRGGEAGSLTRATHVLVIGAYATDSWKHSSFGNKILKAVGMRDNGSPIRIISEEHWTAHL